MFGTLDLSNLGDLSGSFRNLSLSGSGSAPKTTVEWTPTKYDSIALKQDRKLYPHQEQYIDWALERNPPAKDADEYRKASPYCGLIVAADMGLGKTIIMIILAMIRRQHYRKLFPKEPTPPALVVCPASLMNNWVKDVKKFFGDNNSVRVLVLHESMTPKKEFRKLTPRQVSERYDIVVVNYEAVTTAAKKAKQSLLHGNGKLVDHWLPEWYESRANEYELLFSIPWVQVAFDECHAYFTNPETACWDAMLKLRSRYRVGITGTAIKNEGTDMYAQVRVLGFREFTEAKKWSLDFYKQNVAQYVKRMTKEEAKIQLPKMHTHIVSVSPSAEELEALKLMSYLTKVQLADYEQGNLKPGSILALLTRLRQFSIAPTLLTARDPDAAAAGGESKELEFGRSKINLGINEQIAQTEKWMRERQGNAGLKCAKLTALLEIVEKQIPANEQVVIFSAQFTEPLYLVAELFEKRNHKFVMLDGSVTLQERFSRIDQFDNGQVRFMLINSKVGSVGLNLTVATHVIGLNPEWTFVAESQSQARVHRIGQTREVHVWRLVAKNSIEEEMLKLQDIKKARFEAYMLTGNVEEDQAPETKESVQLLKSFVGLGDFSS